MALELNYSFQDRLLHKMAFASSFMQLAAADMERTLFASAYEGATAARPIFITSLPRAGTTLLLEALHLFPSLASHTYRDMPFVLAPIIWSRLSGSFRRPSEKRERAHRDGMEVGFDSPEAFEEILWRTFWPEKFRADGIDLWHKPDQKAEAKTFFVEHMKKIVALRRPDRLRDGRYVSKNNGNIARLEFIGEMFPDAKILLPVRRPIEHARSLLRQHRNFLEMHKESSFVREYMGDIGHYEFGDLHRPIAFPGLSALVANRDPLTLEYWLAYWIAAFEYVAGHKDKVILVSYEDSCANPQRAVAEMCAKLEIADEGMLATVAGMFKDAPAADRKTEVDPSLRSRAEQLHDALLDRVRHSA